MSASESIRGPARLAFVLGVGIALYSGCGIAAAQEGPPDATAGATAARPTRTGPSTAADRPSAVIGAKSRAAASAQRKPRRPALSPSKAIPPSPKARRPDHSTGLASSPNPLTTATVVGTALTNVVQFAVLLTVSALSANPPGPFTATPTLRLNGFDIVPASAEEVTSLYGRWAYMPGAPGFIQGRQKFSVVDRYSGAQAGTFDALVSRGNGIGYTQLLVTSSDPAGGAVAGGPVPAAGSLISNLRIGPIGFSHSALPTPSGNKVSLKITTPFGDFPVPFPFDNAKGLADHTVDNRPMRLGNGYSIAPADPEGETLTATSGIMPGFMTVQGHQVFSVYNANGHPVGSFEGVFTTTSDLFFYTQAVTVTANDGVNVGHLPGQVPPVGSVFNVIYFGNDDHFLLYSSLPARGGADVSVIRSNRGRVTRSALTLIDATAPPPMTLTSAEGLRFVPVSGLQPSGVNGLPPREVETQGYRRFGVYDPAGTRIGTVDTDVFSQWDAFGARSTALLITHVADGGGAVPPVGSIFNFVDFGRRGLGAAHSSVPGPSGNLTSFKVTTPWGDIRLPETFIPVARRTPVSFYRPLGPA